MSLVDDPHETAVPRHSPSMCFPIRQKQHIFPSSAVLSARIAITGFTTRLAQALKRQ